MGSFIENPYVEGALQFDFPAGSGATRYDRWKTHVKVFSSVGHKTAVDFLFPPSGTDVLYMTEIKDFHIGAIAHVESPDACESHESGRYAVLSKALEGETPATEIGQGGLIDMATVIAYGTFDLFHIGHLRPLERAKGMWYNFGV